MPQDKLTVARNTGTLGLYVFHLVQGEKDTTTRARLVTEYIARMQITTADVEDLNKRLAELDEQRRTNPRKRKRVKRPNWRNPDDVLSEMKDQRDDGES